MALRIGGRIGAPAAPTNSASSAPALAESWEVNPDFTQVTFHLRKGRHEPDRSADSPDQNQPVGTGPFTFVEWVQGDHISLKTNPNYWQSAKPYLDAIQIRIFTDPQSMLSELEGGGIDVAILPLLRDAVRLAKDSKYQVIYNQNSGSVNLLLAQTNDGSAPTGNKVFRQALNYATVLQIYQQDLAKIGVTLTLTRPASGQMITRKLQAVC